MVCCQHDDGEQASGQAVNTVAAAAPRGGAYTYIHILCMWGHTYIQSDQKVSVHLMITIQKAGAETF